ncbi:MAG: glycogen synthase [Alphaproteobacteria bacterium]|nr:glycogen synthase [Alphaproteobacteria bacterium]
MSKARINSDLLQSTTFLPSKFNKKKFTITYSVPTTPFALEIQNLAKNQCLGKNAWPKINKIKAWMLSAETATFMKAGGLGMIASELPEAFNRQYSNNGESICVVTPLYTGDTKKKKAFFDGKIYTGAEHKNINLNKLMDIFVPFMDEKETLVRYKTEIFIGVCENTSYIFLANDRFFNIDPHKNNPSTQDGCYIMNKNGINEVERFAFFSKAIYELLKASIQHDIFPNVIIANDWHSGALSGLMKYLPIALLSKNLINEDTADKIRSIPIIHIAHHLGYQGWDYENTARILNSLYEEQTAFVFKNAKSIKNSNSRTTNTLIVHDCYNQASCNFHLADRIITVSKNYLEEVSKELGFGYDFRDILKIRKDHRTFYGIVNGYDKKLISPNVEKISSINSFFGTTDFKVFDRDTLENKRHNKAEFVKLISKIATDKNYKENIIPLIDTYQFEDISTDIKNIEKTPIVCATSRLVEQKGYDVAAQSILSWIKKHNDSKYEMPVFILGGAGNIELFKMLTKLKDRVAKINKSAASRIFVFHGYKDQFAYAIQLAADFYMMPCRFEPCGLTQMEAMAKGSLPIAMSTGGLVDTINNQVDGFRTDVFFSENRHVYGNNTTARRLQNNETAYTETLENALQTFYELPNLLSAMQKNAMQKDFSWNTINGPLNKYYSLLHTGLL